MWTFEFPHPPAEYFSRARSSAGPAAFCLQCGVEETVEGWDRAHRPLSLYHWLLLPAHIFSRNVKMAEMLVLPTRGSPSGHSCLTRLGSGWGDTMVNLNIRHLQGWLKSFPHTAMPSLISILVEFSPSTCLDCSAKGDISVLCVNSTFITAYKRLLFF